VFAIVAALYFTREILNSAGIRLNFDVPLDARGHVLGKATAGPRSARYADGPGVDGGSRLDYLDHCESAR